MTRFSLYVYISELVCCFAELRGSPHVCVIAWQLWYFMRKCKLYKNYVRSRAVPCISGDLLPVDIMMIEPLVVSSVALVQSHQRTVTESGCRTSDISDLLF
jgi:hypothetical protein